MHYPPAGDQCQCGCKIRDILKSMKYVVTAGIATLL